MLTHQQDFQFLIVPRRVGCHDVGLEPVEVKGQSCTDGGCRKTDSDVATTEDGVVDFFEDSTETGWCRVAVLRQTVRLNSLGAGSLVGIVHLLKEFGFNDVAWIENDNDVVNLELRQVVDGQLQRLGSGTLLEIRRQQCDGLLGHAEVAHLIDMVGNDRHVEQPLRIDLS